MKNLFFIHFKHFIHDLIIRNIIIHNVRFHEKMSERDYIISIKKLSKIPLLSISMLLRILSLYSCVTKATS